MHQRIFRSSQPAARCPTAAGTSARATPPPIAASVLASCAHSPLAAGRASRSPSLLCLEWAVLQACRRCPASTVWEAHWVQVFGRVAYSSSVLSFQLSTAGVRGSVPGQLLPQELPPLSRTNPDLVACAAGTGRTGSYAPRKQPSMQPSLGAFRLHSARQAQLTRLGWPPSRVSGSRALALGRLARTS